MTVQSTIADKLRNALAPSHLEVINESHGHKVPQGSETHFKVVVVAAEFAELGRVKRHQRVYQLLAEELANGVHALALHAYSPEQWQQVAAAPESPACLGGAKR